MTNWCYTNCSICDFILSGSTDVPHPLRIGLAYSLFESSALFSFTFLFLRLIQPTTSKPVQPFCVKPVESWKPGVALQRRTLLWLPIMRWMKTEAAAALGVANSVIPGNVGWCASWLEFHWTTCKSYLEICRLARKIFIQFPLSIIAERYKFRRVKEQLVPLFQSLR